MGSNSSKSNDELVDSLVSGNQIKDSNVERAFRLVDRGRFFPSNHVIEAYRDSPFKIPEAEIDNWQPGLLHISAPGMYATVLEKLELRRGHSFLNIGSGSGWLNTTVGFLIGSDGVNHGIEIHENLVKYSVERRAETLSCPELAPFSFAVPMFVHGNGLSQKISAGLPRYDRIYCGAAVTSMKQIDRLVRLLEISGRLICPVNGNLMCYRRTGEKRFLAQRLLACSFADLVRPAKTDNPYLLPKINRPDFLQRLCRENIRSLIREKVWKNNPPKMRNMANKEAVIRPVYLTAGEQNFEAQVNAAGMAPWGDFAHVQFAVVAGGGGQNHFEVRRLEEDNSRVQVYDLKDEEDEDEDENQQIVPPPPPLDRFVRPRNLAQAIQRRQRPPQDDEEDVDEMAELRLAALVRLQEEHADFLGADEVNIHPAFRDEGMESDEDEQEEEEAGPADDGSSSDDGEGPIIAPRDPERAGDVSDPDAEVELIMRPDNPPPPDVMEERNREHRRVSRQQMQVMRRRRHSHGDDEQSDEEEEEEEDSSLRYRRRQPAQEKRRKVEMHPESRDERQIRVQRESIEKFRMLFNNRINSMPIPRHMAAYLQHADGWL